MGAELGKEGFKRFVSDMATKLLAKSRSFRKLQNTISKVERFVDKANNIKKKVNKVLGALGSFGKSSRVSGRQNVLLPSRGRSANASFRSDRDPPGE